MGSALVTMAKGVVAVVSVPSWLGAAFFVAWFWPGAQSGQTCDPGHHSWCTPGYGMPQYVTVSVLVGLASVLLLTALVGRVRRVRRLAGAWVVACACAVVAGAAVTVVPALLETHAPPWWFAG
jgi:small-conductance mechanosensitive channel